MARTKKEAEEVIKEEIPAAEVVTQAVEETKVAKAGKKSAKAIAQKEALETKKARKAEKDTSDIKPAKVIKVTRSRLERSGKRLKAVSQLVDKSKAYSLADAIELAVKTSTVKFDATLELHANLNVDPRQADQNIRDNLVLPEGTGKQVRVAVFVEPDMSAAAKTAGADLFDQEQLLADLDKEVVNFDVLIATPQTMAKLGKYARILGPKGLMPNPKSGTVTADVAKAVKEAKAGRIEYRVDPTSIVHISFGKVSFGKDRLLTNANAVVNSLKSTKPASVKGTFVKSAYLTTTMGPSIKLDSSTF